MMPAPWRSRLASDRRMKNACGRIGEVHVDYTAQYNTLCVIILDCIIDVPNHRHGSAWRLGPSVRGQAGEIASTRSGLPLPSTIFSGAAITIAPVAGNW